MKRLIALLLVILLTFALCACDGGTSTTVEHKKASISAKIDANGTAFIPMMDGTVVSINGDVEEAEITDDRNTIVVLESDGLLYFTSPTSTTEKTTIATNVETLSVVRSTGVIYKDEESEVYRYTFADAANVSLGTDVALAVAENTLSALIADDQGDIYILAHNSSEREKIGTYDESCSVEEITDDCKMAVWVEKDESAETHTMHLYVNGEHHKLEEVDYEYNRTYAYFNKAATFVAVTNLYSENVHFIPIGGTDVVCAKLGSELSEGVVYTANGILTEDSSKEITGLYVLTDADNGSNLYHISMDGGREKMANNIESIAIKNGRIYYLNTKSDLYTAKLDGSMLVDETKISSDVYTYEVSADGKYIYYIKNLDENVGSLYRCNSASPDEPEKISSNVYNYYSSYWASAYFCLSTDGKTVYYFEDVEEGIGGTYSDCGTLKCAAEGSEPVRISTDVIVTQPISGLYDWNINPNAFVFEKYITVDDDGNLLVNWVYYNGTETTTLAKEVYH